MTPERWRQIAEHYNAIQDCAPEQREARLATCDPEVRLEIVRMLEQDSSGKLLDISSTELLPDETGKSIAAGSQLGPYRIEEFIGSGGMGEVFQAVDTRLGRKVAIKISAERFSNRFEREARAIAALNHHYICTLYDIGPNYLVMELVEGETLAHRLKKGKLPVDETIRYGSQIADALAEAHAKGIIHRDLKPSNIMLTRSGVKLLDFGIAESLEDEPVTAVSAMVGTPAYMAPEQKAGQTADARSDIYALGLILEEMIGSAPSGLARVIDRCTARDPKDRYQSAEEVRAALAGAIPQGGQRRTLLWAAGSAMVLLLLLVSLWIVRRPPKPPATLQSIVVTTFSNLSKDHQDDYVGAGLAEDVLTQLAAGGRVAVILVPELAGKDPIALAKRVNAGGVVYGTFRHNGKEFLVTARLVDGSTGSIRWSQSYTRDERTLTGLHYEIADAVASAIGAAARNRLQSGTRDPAALQNYWRGVAAIKSDQSGADLAVESLKEAVRLEPEFPEALAALALAIGRRAVFLTGSRRASADLEEPYARKAAILAPDLSESEAALADVALARFQWTESMPHLRRALSLNPLNEIAREELIVSFAANGRFEEALAVGREGLSLDALSPNAHWIMGHTLYMSGRFKEALSELEEGERLDPQLMTTFRTETMVLVALGRYDEATEVFAKYARRNRPYVEGCRAAAAGDMKTARRIADALPDGDWKAKLYSAIGDLDAAMSQLEKIVDEGHIATTWIKVDPGYRNVRLKHPRYPDLLRRAGFSDTPNFQ